MPFAAASLLRYACCPGYSGRTGGVVNHTALPEARVTLGKLQKLTGAQESDIATRPELAPL